MTYNNQTKDVKRIICKLKSILRFENMQQCESLNQFKPGSYQNMKGRKHYLDNRQELAHGNKSYARCQPFWHHIILFYAHN